MIHPTAVVSPGAQLGENISIGPYTVIDEQVSLGANSRVGPHVHLTGHTLIGENARIHKGAVIGDEPQDHDYTPDQRSLTRIGKNCVLREYVTIHRGTGNNTETVIGDDCMFMAFAHVAHNCRIGDHVIIANATVLAGHVQIEDRATISAGVMIHQFARIGAYAMVGGACLCPKDVAPYVLMGSDGRVYGVNSIGLRRAGFSPETRRAIKLAIRQLFFETAPRQQVLAQLETDYAGIPEILHLVQFFRASHRGVQGTRPKVRGLHQEK